MPETILPGGPNDLLPRPPALPTDPFGSAKVLINRAQKHIHDLNDAGKLLLNGKTYTSVVDHDPDTGEDVYKLKGFYVPWELSAIAADAVNNLRAVLDHSFCACSEMLGGPDPKNLHFPFGESLSDFEGRLSSIWPGMPAEIDATLRAVRPFKSGAGGNGNDDFWAISKLSNAYKHRAVAALATVVPEITSVEYIALPEGGRLIEPAMWDPEKNEIEFARAPHGKHLYHKLHIATDIAFGEVEVLKGKPAALTLNRLLQEVSNLGMALEAHSKWIVAAQKP